MLTEPTTTPPQQWQRRIYGVIVGGLFTSQLHVGSVSATPELALLVGNLYAYLVSPKHKLRLRFNGKQQLAQQIYEFSFTGASGFDFQPGQYLEWTLPQHKNDSRGNRRIFSIASAANDQNLCFTVRVPESSSTFKKDLLALESGDVMIAGQLTGDFVLPPELNQKLVLIAGGIGITPFVSMARTMIKTQQKRDIVLFYLVSQAADFCYKDLWQQAAELGLRVIPIVSKPTAEWSGLTGHLTDELLRQQVPDYKIRRFYLSGPQGLVESYKQLLHQLAIRQRQIVTDYFPGY